MRASDSPQATIIMVTSYCPDIFPYNERSNSVALLELTCPLNSIDHLNSAWDRKQEKKEYQELPSELGISCVYDTIELSVLGYYLPASLFINQLCQFHSR